MTGRVSSLNLGRCKCPTFRQLAKFRAEQCRRACVTEWPANRGTSLLAPLLIRLKRSQLRLSKTIVGLCSEKSLRSCSTMPALPAPYLRGSWKTKQGARRASGQSLLLALTDAQDFDDEKRRLRTMQSTQMDMKEYGYFAGNHWR